MVPYNPDDDRLQNAMFFETGAQGSQFILVETFARLKGIPLNSVQRDFAGIFARQFGDRSIRPSDESFESTSEAPFFHVISSVDGIMQDPSKGAILTGEPS